MEIQTRISAMLGWEHLKFFRGGKSCCCKQDDLSSLGLLCYVYWYWFFCHLYLTAFLFPSLVAHTRPAEPPEPLVIYYVGAKGVWSCGLQLSECWSVPVADTISYGFSLSTSFASAFVPSSLVKEDVRCTWSIHPLPEQSTPQHMLFFFYTLQTLLFTGFVFHPFHLILFRIWIPG